MSKFDVLTKYTTMFQLDIIGEWVIDKKTMEHRSVQYRWLL